MKKTAATKRIVTIATASALLLMGCNKGGGSYSMLPASQTFNQAANVVTLRPIDVLWVVDNSLSMQAAQANLASNYSAFIAKFQALGIDYHMAVTTTDAYLANPFFNNKYSNYSATNAVFKTGSTGAYGLGDSGITVMTSKNTTPTVFQQNMSEGTAGSGDERAFSSIVQALNDPTNAASGFRRPGAFLSVIILSDEDDFSGTATFADHFSQGIAQNYVGDHNYSVASPQLQTVTDFITQMDTLAGGHSNYSISAIYADTPACVAQLLPVSLASIQAQRYPAAVAATKGVSGSICGNFATTLTNISQSIVSLASTFALGRQPVPSTIVITVNGNVVPEDPTNGWTYLAASNSIQFNGTAVPPANAVIGVNFTPATITNN